jgi:hypothetical protein
MKRQSNFAFAGSLFLLVVATGCGVNERDGQCASLIGGGRYCLQSTESILPFEAQQKVEASFRGQRETMIVDLEVGVEGMRLVGLTPFGQSLLKVNYDNRAVTATPMADTRLSPIQLIALLQIALWPADALRDGLEEPLRIEDKPGRRLILNRNDVTLTITYVGARAPYQRITVNFQAADIQLDIETLPETVTWHSEAER